MRPGFKTLVEEPISTEERREIAAKFVKDQNFAFPALLDAIDNKTGIDYATHPDRLYLVGKDGNLAWVGERGPAGFKPNELKAAILAETGRKQPAPTNGQADRRPGPPGRNGFRAIGGPSVARLFRMIPVMAALDSDQDGEISARELENAATALRTLDKDGNNKLTEDELAPRMGGRSFGERNRGSSRPNPGQP